ncbi:MAG: hypothetical protein PVI86_18380 [Phycisphaerae bacterium]|jgi:hypothetical protein
MHRHTYYTLTLVIFGLTCLTGCPNGTPQGDQHPDDADNTGMDGQDPTGGDPDDGALTVGEDALPEFMVPDVNAASARFSQDVSPRDYLGEVSAWYFGHST